MSNQASSNESTHIQPDNADLQNLSAQGTTDATAPQDICVLDDHADMSATVISTPEAGVNPEVLMQAGHKYDFDFEQSDILSMTNVGGDVVMALSCGQSITLKNFDVVMGGANAPVLAFAEVIDFSDFMSLISVADVAPSVEELAAVEPAAGDDAGDTMGALAQELAVIETAAGDEAGAVNDGGRGGYGFQSSVDAQGVNSLNNIGAIDATARGFDAANFNVEDDLFIAQAPAFDDAPEIISTGGSSADGTGDVVREGGIGPDTPLVMNGQVVVDFGADGAGEMCANGEFSINGVAGGDLTSGGEAVVIEASPEGYVGMVGGEVAFTFTIDGETGEWVYTQYMPFDHADGTDPNDTLNLEFGVKATDADGDEVSTIVIVSVEDDGPDAVKPDDNSIDEADGAQQVHGDINVDFGADGVGSIELTGDFSVNGVDSGDLSSGGTPIDVSLVNGVMVGTVGGEIIFALQLNPETGEYTFSLLGPLDHLADDDVLSLSFDVLATDGDGDSIHTNIVINVNDDEPSIEVRAGAVDEAGLADGGVITITRTMEHDFGADGPGSIEPTGNFTAYFQVGGQAQDLTSGGEPVDVAMTADGYVGTLPDGTVVFTLSIDPETGTHTYTQYEGIDHPGEGDDVIWLKFEVQITDADGDTSIARIQIDVRDDGPAPVEDPAAVAVNEADLTDGPIEVVREIDVDFGGDGAGSFAPTGNVMVFFEVGGQQQQLTSGGEDVTIISTDHGYEGILADGTVIFTLTVDVETGEYTYTQYAGVDQPGEGDDVIWLKFEMEGFDADGDSTGPFTIQLDIRDSVPDIDSVAFAVHEDDLDDGPIVVNGQVDHDFGGDVEGGAITPTGASFVLFDFGGDHQTLTSGGAEVEITTTADGYMGMTADGTLVFTLSIDSATGEYVYTQHAGVDHPDNAENAIWLKFGVQITDGDGDTSGNSEGDYAFIQIDIYDSNPAAQDDFAVTNGTDEVDGNVLDNDDIGADSPGVVTQVKFGDIVIDVPESGSAIIKGDHGTLELFANGTYTYTPFTSETSEFNPVAADAAGFDDSISRDGITISIANEGNYDITWVDTPDGSGLGIDNLHTGDSHKVWPLGEAFDIVLDTLADILTLTISELGSNTNAGDKGADFIITLADGTEVTGERQFDPSMIVDGSFDLVLNAVDYGQEIIGVRLSSVNSGDYAGTSFLLNNVIAETKGHDGTGEDVFAYTVSDADGDTDTATLTFTNNGEEGAQLLTQGEDDGVVALNADMVDAVTLTGFTQNQQTQNTMTNAALNTAIILMAASVADIAQTLAAVDGDAVVTGIEMPVHDVVLFAPDNAFDVDMSKEEFAKMQAQKAGDQTNDDITLDTALGAQDAIEMAEILFAPEDIVLGAPQGQITQANQVDDGAIAKAKSAAANDDYDALTAAAKTQDTSAVEKAKMAEMLDTKNADGEDLVLYAGKIALEDVINLDIANDAQQAIDTFVEATSVAEADIVPLTVAPQHAAAFVIGAPVADLTPVDEDLVSAQANASVI